jgi:monoamine oxidase
LVAAMAMNSMAYVLNCPADTVEKEIKAFYFKNWKTDAFTSGAYSYATVETPAARKILNTPIENTLYFAGEALYDGPHTGTVEAALVTGKEAARRIIATID